MMRSLWTAASGMITQQQNVDVIANNLANVNSTSYKKENTEFKNLLYQTVQTKTTSANGERKPVGAQIGLGVRTSAITSSFTQGSLKQTEAPFDFAIDGDGFFQVQGEDGETYYTRNGNFQMAVAGTGLMLTNMDGLPVMDTNGSRIIFDSSIDVSTLTVQPNGAIYHPDDLATLADLAGQPESAERTAKIAAIKPMFTVTLAQFSNPAGLEKTGDLLYRATDASGEAMLESNSASLKKSRLMQGYLEGSNVQVADEMVNLIVAQRAYEMNSKAIQASDTMLEQANNLKR